MRPYNKRKSLKLKGKSVFCPQSTKALRPKLKTELTLNKDKQETQNEETSGPDDAPLSTYPLFSFYFFIIFLMFSLRFLFFSLLFVFFLVFLLSVPSPACCMFSFICFLFFSSSFSSSSSSSSSSSFLSFFLPFFFFLYYYFFLSSSFYLYFFLLLLLLLLLASLCWLASNYLKIPQNTPPINIWKPIKQAPAE